MSVGGPPARTLSLTVAVTREGDRDVAQCLAVDGSSFGDTHAEALAKATEALELWFEGKPAPEPLARPAVPPLTYGSRSEPGASPVTVRQRGPGEEGLRALSLPGTA